MVRVTFTKDAMQQICFGIVIRFAELVEKTRIKTLCSRKVLKCKAMLKLQIVEIYFQRGFVKNPIYHYMGKLFSATFCIKVVLSQPDAHNIAKKVDWKWWYKCFC